MYHQLVRVRVGRKEMEAVKVSCDWRSKLDNSGGGTHIHILMFCTGFAQLISFLNRLMVCEHEYTKSPPGL